MKGIQAPFVPNVQTGLIAEGIFALLRADVDFCAKVGTVDQAAAEQGVTPRQLTRRERPGKAAKPTTSGRPSKPPWGGSPEEAEEANKARAYTE
jgi:hypothetical protein